MSRTDEEGERMAATTDIARRSEALVESRRHALGVEEGTARRMWSVARMLAGTTIVAEPLRGNPAAVMGVGLHLAALGLDLTLPNLKLMHVWDHKGIQMMEHYQLRLGLIMRAGHDAWKIEVTDKRAAFGLRRKGSTRDQEFEYTIADAERAGLLRNDVWKLHRPVMLAARAIGLMWKWGAPDAMWGLPPLEDPVPVLGDTDAYVIDAEVASDPVAHDPELASADDVAVIRDAIARLDTATRKTLADEWRAAGLADLRGPFPAADVTSALLLVTRHLISAGIPSPAGPDGEGRTPTPSPSTPDDPGRPFEEEED